MKVIKLIFIAFILSIWVMLIFYPYFDLIFMMGDLTVGYVAGAIGISLISLITFLYTVKRTNWVSRFV